uniref:hypothetical protein n=1 Tax=Peptostreptococcus faecalis TaxID=2045015 RepID=UPI002E8E22BD|nr:hypothetical protein [Peptostreptococcus faecalis]
MEKILEINSLISDFVWGWPMLILLLGTGLYLGIRTKFVVLTHFRFMMKNTIIKLFSKAKHHGEGEVTPFQAVSTALASTVGTGM